MANVNKPMGLSPVQYLNGAPWNGQARLYSIAASYNTALAVGDPVDLSGTADANGVPGIVLATAGATHPILGVIVGLGTYEGLVANPSNLNSIVRPASDPAAWYAMVVDDPNVIFEVQEDAAGVAFAATDICANAVLAAGTNNGYTSTWVVTEATAPAADATYQLQLLGLARRSNNAFGHYAKLLVRINLHRFHAATAGV